MSALRHAPLMFAGEELDPLAGDPVPACGHRRREPPAVDDQPAPAVDHLDDVAFRRQAQIVAMPGAIAVAAVGARRTGGKPERNGEQQAGDHTFGHRTFSWLAHPRRDGGAPPSLPQAPRQNHRPRIRPKNCRCAAPNPSRAGNRPP
jgi:hypothetical protein